MSDPATMILEDGSGLVLIHFMFQSPAGMIRLKGIPLGASGEETWKLACVPNMTEMAQAHNRPLPMHRTDDPRAVTCPQCRETQEFREKMAQVRQAESGARYVS